MLRVKIFLNYIWLFLIHVKDLQFKYAHIYPEAAIIYSCKKINDDFISFYITKRT